MDESALSFNQYAEYLCVYGSVFASYLELFVFLIPPLVDKFRAKLMKQREERP